MEGFVFLGASVLGDDPVCYCLNTAHRLFNATISLFAILNAITLCFYQPGIYDDEKNLNNLLVRRACGLIRVVYGWSWSLQCLSPFSHHIDLHHHCVYPGVHAGVRLEDCGLWPDLPPKVVPEKRGIHHGCLHHHLWVRRWSLTRQWHSCIKLLNKAADSTIFYTALLQYFCICT